MLRRFFLTSLLAMALLTLAPPASASEKPCQDPGDEACEMGVPTCIDAFGVSFNGCEAYADFPLLVIRCEWDGLLPDDAHCTPTPPRAAERGLEGCRVGASQSVAVPFVQCEGKSYYKDPFMYCEWEDSLLPDRDDCIAK